jgi:Golgi nucleoside diphosphatase
MRVKELKEIIKDLPDEMPVGLIDATTDDTDDMNYSLSKDNFDVGDCVNEYEEIVGKMLFIYFENHLNENPI